MTIFGRVVRWLRGRPVWAGNRYDPGDRRRLSTDMEQTKIASVPGPTSRRALYISVDQPGRAAISPVALSAGRARPPFQKPTLQKSCGLSGT